MNVKMRNLYMSGDSFKIFKHCVWNFAFELVVGLGRVIWDKTSVFPQILLSRLKSTYQTAMQKSVTCGQLLFTVLSQVRIEWLLIWILIEKYD